MKKIIYSILSLVIVTVAFTSCVKDTNYDTPQIQCDDIDALNEFLKDQTLVTIKSVLNDYVGEMKVYEDNSTYIVGYVVSDDRTGNFYKELYIQDKIEETEDSEDPIHAIKLGIDMRSLFTKYDVGRMIYIKLDGLALDNSHGELTLGEKNIDGEFDEMRENRAKKNIFRSCDTFDVVPLILGTPSSVNFSHLGKLVQFENMQFEDDLIGEAYLNPLDLYDTGRTLTNVLDGSVIIVETSSFANFGTIPLDTARGSIKGILSRNYTDSYFVLRISDPAEDLTFDLERYNPNYIFEEDFESYEYDDTTFGDWTNINANGGGTLFTVKAYGGNKYLQGAAFGSGEDPLEMWAVSPAITLNEDVAERFLSFKTKTGYNNGAALSTYISTDFAGDVTTATWIPLSDAILADGPSSGYETSFTSSGPLDILSYSGDIYVAFKYEGGTGGITTTFQIDDLVVIEN